MHNPPDRTKGQALRDLEGDELLSRLDRYVHPFDLVGSLGVGRDEVAHSRLLAALLNPKRHRGAETMLRSLLRDILRLRSLDGDTGEHVETILAETWKHVEVQREFKSIDVVVRITSPSRTVVVGIENKIDAGEGEDQLGRYQEALRRAYPKNAALIVFLTPTGRDPATAIPNHAVSAVSAGYDLIVAATEEVLRETESGSRDEHALSEVVAHFKENILSEDTEVKALVRDLWKSHGRALRLAIKHRPRLEDVRDLYEALLRERFGDDNAYIYYWPSRGELREIKMFLHSWTDAGFPFQFILSLNDEGSPLVRLLMWRDSYDEKATFLKKWARTVNASDPALVDSESTKLPHWVGWRRVFSEEDSPPDAVLDNQAFDDATAKEAAEAMVALYEKLESHTIGA